MGDGRPKMKDLCVAFENRYKLLLTHLSELHLGSEETSETFGPKHFEITHQEDQDKDNVLDVKSASNSRCHPKLRRRHSDGAYSLPTTLKSTRRSATTGLPKLPLRRLSSDSIATGNTVQAKATRYINNQGSEETFGPKHFEITCQEDQDKDNALDDSSASNSRCQSTVSHPKLQRRHSDVAYSLPTTLNNSRRSALLLYSSTSGLPKLPLRRFSSDSIATGNTVQAIATRHINNQGVNGVKRKSIPEDKTVPYDLSEAHEHRNLARRRSSSRCSAARWRRFSASTCRDSKWRVKLHKRSLSVDDDDGGDFGNTLSRSSSSSGFSSQSSLF